MKRKYLVIFLLIIVPLVMISCKKSDTVSPVALNNVDIDVLSNKKMLSIINDSTLKEGVYLIETNSNKYIYFNGNNNYYTNITCNLDNNLLIINTETEKNSNNSNKKLYLIQEKNISSSEDKTQLYSSIRLIINNKETKLHTFIISN